MALQKWFQILLLQMFLLLFTIQLVLSEYECVSGLLTAGYTVPKGDIVLEYGDDLNITCVLYDREAKNENVTLMFQRNYETLRSGENNTLIEKINATSIRLYVKNPPKVTSDSYKCITNNTHRSVCLNVVAVGNKPLPVDDFKCISYNYDNLTCTFTPPNNYIRTDYELVYYLPGRASRDAIKCPNLTRSTEDKRKLSCVWSIGTTPQYRQAHDKLDFVLSMKNVLGTNKNNFTFRHFENVLSAPPMNLTVINKTTSSFYLSWEVPQSMKNYPPGVKHRIFYQLEHDEQWHMGPLKSTQYLDKTTVYYNLTGLKYPYYYYDIRVSLLGAASNINNEEMWSKNTSIVVRTSSQIPAAPPKTTVGGFEITRPSLQYREALIYWQQISNVEKNGPEFTYSVSVEGDDNMKPDNLSSSYAKFNKLLNSQIYKFFIWSKNVNGTSIDKSEVIIPRKSDCVSLPASFNKVEFDGGKYELTWEPPRLEPHQVLTNYTIFWCDHKRDRPHQCTGFVNWTIVDKEDTVKTIEVSTNQIYQFAIAANTETGSSGMLWAQCTVLYSTNTGKMKRVWINRVGSTYIEVSWKLDCADRIGSVGGFIIYYCPITSRVQLQCEGEKQNVTFLGDANVFGGNITNLRPYTTYSLTVAVFTKNNSYSQESDALSNTTLEAAPSSPPTDLKVVNVTNSTITLVWQPPSATNGKLKDYIVYYNDNEYKFNPGVSGTLEHLMSYTNYSISIKACTTECSETSKPLTITTKMGYPSQTGKPTVYFSNDSHVGVTWMKPSNPRGKNDYYEVQFKQKYSYENKTIPIFNVTDVYYNFENCGDSGDYNTFFISVRAVNIIDGISYHGPWSEESENSCQIAVFFEGYLVYCLIFIIVIFMGVIYYVIKISYRKYKRMKNVELKLPGDLEKVISCELTLNWSSEKQSLPQQQQQQLNHEAPADEQVLLEKLTDDRLSGESSGCSSGHVSVASIDDSEMHDSNNDSGTEQQAPSTPRSSTSSLINNDDGNGTSLRLRNVTNARGYVLHMPTTKPIQPPPPGNYSLTGDLNSLTNTNTGNNNIMSDNFSSHPPSSTVVVGVRTTPPITTTTIIPDYNNKIISCNNNDVIIDNIINKSSPFTMIMSDDIINKSVNPSYVPFDRDQTPVKNNAGYVVPHGLAAKDLLNCGNIKPTIISGSGGGVGGATDDNKPYYVKADNMFLRNNLKED